MRYVLFAFTAPWSVIVGWGGLGLLFCLGIVKDFRWEPTLVLTAVFRDWVVKPRKLPWSKEPMPLWRFSTTLGRAIMYQPSHRAPEGQPWTSVQVHEHVHINQTEDLMLLSFIVGLVVFLSVGLSTGIWDTAGLLGFLLWTSGGMWQLPNFIGALRHLGEVEKPADVGWVSFVVMHIMYRRSEHERSAYAQTDLWGPGGSMWLDHQR